MLRVNGEEVVDLHEVCAENGLVYETVRHWQYKKNSNYPPFPLPKVHFNHKAYYKASEIKAWFRRKSYIDHLIPVRDLSYMMFGNRTTITNQRGRGLSLPFPYAVKRKKGTAFEFFYNSEVVKAWWKQYDCKQFVRLGYFLKSIGSKPLRGRKGLEMSRYLCSRCRYVQFKKSCSFWFVKDDVDKLIGAVNVNQRGTGKKNP